MAKRPTGALDTPSLAPEGDADWRGFRSRPQPTTLPPGISRYAENVRMDRTTVRPRAGAKALSTDIVLANPPLVLDFVLPDAEIVIHSITRVSQTATVSTRTDHGLITGNFVVISGAVEPEYNGDFQVTVTGVRSFTITVSGSPATPSSIGLASWASQTIPEANAWQSVAWSPALSLFAAVSNGGTNRVMTSPDGVTWTSRAVTTGSWGGIVWAPELAIFVAVGSNAVMTSTDGITWTPQTAAESNPWLSVVWAPSLTLLVAVANSGTNRVMTSPDGVTWTPHAASEASGWRCVTWSPAEALFVAVAPSGTNRIMTSPDGTTWTSLVGGVSTSAAYFGVTWAPELALFVLVASSGGPIVATSPDGTTWTSQSNASSAYRAVIWAASIGLLIAVSDAGANRISTSPDGVNWIATAAPEANAWVALAWSPSVGCVAAVSNTGTNRVMRALSEDNAVAVKGLPLYEVYEDRIRSGCVYTDDDRVEGIVRAGQSRAFLYREGEASVEIGYPANETIAEDDEADLLAHLGFVYLFRGRAAGPVLEITSVSRSSTTVTVTTAADHNMQTGDWVRLPNQADEEYRGVWQIVVTDTDEFTYEIAATPTDPASIPGTCYRVKPPLKWDRNPANDFVVVTTGGFPTSLHVRMPPADWGIAFNRQMILPFGVDELIMSDFGVDDVFDTQLAQLRIRPGGPDWIVAAHPGARTQVMVLYRKSLHLVTRNSTDLTVSSVDQVPGEQSIGCVARKTVRTCGNFVAWLADQGVQLAALTTELNLLTARDPLSANIHDIIKRINWSAAGRAVAQYHDNRYFLAVPLDGSEVNNYILVFNFLNASPDSPYGEWESVDRYPGDFDAVELLVMSYEGRQLLHAVSSTGYVYVLEVGEQDEHGSPGGSTGSYDIYGKALGRRLLFGTLQQKKFKLVRVDVELEAGAQVQVQFSTLNPDLTRTVKDYTATEAEEKTLSARLRQRGVSGAVDLLMPVGRPTVKAVELEAAVPGSNAKDQS